MHKFLKKKKHTHSAFITAPSKLNGTKLAGDIYALKPNIVSVVDVRIPIEAMPTLLSAGRYSGLEPLEVTTPVYVFSTGSGFN